MTFFLLLIIVVGFFLYFKVILPREKKLKEQQLMEDVERLEKEEQEKERLRILTRNKNMILEINSYFEKYVLKDSIIIDSNIWMNPDYKNFFITLREQLKSNNNKIVLYGPQFDEICNIKKRTHFGNEVNFRARLAITRIEESQLNERLIIKPLTIDAVRGAYADPVIITMILKLLDNNENVVLISDDKELRIRMRGLAENKKYNCVVIPGNDLMEKSDAYCRIKNIHYEEPDYETYYSESDEDAQLHDDDQTQYEDKEPQVLKENVIYLGS
jgi:hypothetical protein